MKMRLFATLFFALLALATAGCGDKTERDASTANRPGPVKVASAGPTRLPIHPL